MQEIRRLFPKFSEIFIPTLLFALRSKIKVQIVNETMLSNSRSRTKNSSTTLLSVHSKRVVKARTCYSRNAKGKMQGRRGTHACKRTYRHNNGRH